MVSLNITNREFSTEDWNQMVIEAAESCKEGRERKNICRTIYPFEGTRGICFLELKTDQEIKKAFQQYGSLNFNCGRMPLREVLNITRICSLNDPIAEPEKNDLIKSLLVFSSRAEEKYNDGFKGIVRKIIAIFFNLFATDEVSLFGMPGTNVGLKVVENSNKGKLPWFIGSNADFVRLINTQPKGAIVEHLERTWLLNN